MEIPKQLQDEIWDYCRINGITNIDEFMLKLLKQGFTINKFGATPAAVKEKITEPSPIVDKPVEVSKSQKECQEELKKALLENTKLSKELEIEKKKNKKDIYGE